MDLYSARIHQLSGDFLRRIITPAHKAHTVIPETISGCPGEYTAQLLPTAHIGLGLINQLCPHRYPFNPWVERSKFMD